MKSKRKFLVFFISIIMIFTLIPDFSLATEADAPDESIMEESPAGEPMAEPETPLEETDVTDPADPQPAETDSDQETEEPLIAPEVPTIKLTATLDLKLKLSWSVKDCSGYEFVLYKDTSSSAKIIKITDPDRNSYLASKVLGKSIRNSTTYRAKIRAFNLYETEDGTLKEVYSSWSTPAKYTTVKAGWYKKNGLKYYYKDNKLLKGRHKIKGNPYYFDSNGVYRGSCKTMWRKVKGARSGQKILIAVCTNCNRLCIYKGKRNHWVVSKYALCSTGRMQYRRDRGYRTSKTPCRSWTMYKKRGRYLHFGEEDGHTCWYCTRLGKAPSNYFFHSIVFNPFSKSSIRDSRLGQNVSAGCIRLSLKNAKWIYDNAKPGTKTVTVRHPKK